MNLITSNKWQKKSLENITDQKRLETLNVIYGPCLDLVSYKPTIKRYESIGSNLNTTCILDDFLNNYLKILRYNSIKSIEVIEINTDVWMK